MVYLYLQVPKKIYHTWILCFFVYRIDTTDRGRKNSGDERTSEMWLWVLVIMATMDLGKKHLKRQGNPDVVGMDCVL